MVTRSHSIRVRPWSSQQGILGGVVIGASLVALFFFARGRSAARPPELPPQPIVAAFDMIEVSVPASAVPAGTRLRDIPLRRISYPRHQVPEGAVVDVGLLGDAVSVTSLPAGLPLHAGNFSKKTVTSNPVIERIPPGMRAMTIKVDATSAVEGWAGSGSTVDVLLIAHERTTVIAEKVKILSAERVVAPVEGSGSPQVPSTVTLLVDQEQCLAINTAIPLGKIAFALRSPDDQEGWLTAQYTAENFKDRASSVDRERGGVSGFISIRGEDGQKSFALSSGRWIETEVIPEGFRVMKTHDQHIKSAVPSEEMHAKRTSRRDP